MQRWSSVMIAVVAVLVLLIVAVVAPSESARNDAIVLMVPFGQHEVDLNLWPHAGGVYAVVWHQNAAAGTQTRLAAVSLPLWTLPLALACPFMVAAVAVHLITPRSHAQHTNRDQRDGDLSQR